VVANPTRHHVPPPVYPAGLRPAGAAHPVRGGPARPPGSPLDPEAGQPMFRSPCVGAGYLSHPHREPRKPPAAPLGPGDLIRVGSASRPPSSDGLATPVSCCLPGGGTGPVGNGCGPASPARYRGRSKDAAPVRAAGGCGRVDVRSTGPPRRVIEAPSPASRWALGHLLSALAGAGLGFATGHATTTAASPPHGRRSNLDRQPAVSDDPYRVPPAAPPERG